MIGKGAPDLNDWNGTSASVNGLIGGGNMLGARDPVGSIDILATEDAAAGGDAMFTVAIDGVYRGTFLARAAEGMTPQDFQFTGIASGTHDVAVSFVNDYWAGPGGADRNLYIDGIQGSGLQVPNTSAGMYMNGTDHFAVPV